MCSATASNDKLEQGCEFDSIFRGFFDRFFTSFKDEMGMTGRMTHIAVDLRITTRNG